MDFSTLGEDARVAYQEDDGNVQEERNHGVGQENKVSHILNVRPGHARNLDHKRSDAVHDRASRREVVKRHKRVHLELCA